MFLKSERTQVILSDDLRAFGYQVRYSGRRCSLPGI
jgi:hypothetical protein